MMTIKNSTIDKLNQEYGIGFPTDISIYEEIENFEDAEYIYCVAYEMLIRTDEYKKILEEYEPLKNKLKKDMSTDEFVLLRDLIFRMNALGLKKTSFLGFDCGEDRDNVLKKIKYYDEIRKSPWSVRMLHKFQLDEKEDIFYLLAKFYFEKGKLYKRNVYDSTFTPTDLVKNQEVMDLLREKSNDQTEKYAEFRNFLNKYGIPCINKETTECSYKSLDSNDIYLKELDEEFLSTLKEKKITNCLFRQNQILHIKI